MSLVTTQIRLSVRTAAGAAVPAAKVRCTLTHAEVDGALVVPGMVESITDAAGDCTLALWPNQRGTMGSQYQVMLADSEGTLLLVGAISVPDATVPNQPVPFELLLTQPPYARLPLTVAATQQLQAAQVAIAGSVAQSSQSAVDAAALAGTATAQAGIATTGAGTATTQAGIATTQAGIATAQAGIATTGAGTSTTQAGIATAQAGIATLGADIAIAQAAIATAQATIATTGAGTSTTQAGIATAQATIATAQAVTATSGAGTATAQSGVATAQAVIATNQSNTAAAQAAAAAASAASAASVVQQDLSGVQAAALHRSPNATVAIGIYNTSKDSDGGAWRKRMEHTSWMREPLNGAWRGACATEAACRAISGATTGDYFQLISDGKHYKLSAGSGIVEVLNGNKAEFPALPAIAASDANLDIYDLTAPGRPLWKRFPNTGAMAVGTITGVACLNGAIHVTGSLGLVTIDFIANFIRFRNASGVTRQNGIETRATAALLAEAGQTAIGASGALSVAVRALPNAPTDPVTVLPVPTIAIALNTGSSAVSVIKSDGTVANPALTYVANNIDIDEQGTVIVSGENSKNIRKIQAPLYTTVLALSGGPLGLGGTSTPLTNSAGNTAVKNMYGLVAGSGYLHFMRENPASPANSMAASIGPTFNTGYMFGDVRRVLLSSNVAETVSGADLVTGDNATFASGVGSWASSSAFASTAAAVGGELQVTATGGVGGRQILSFATTVGMTYVLNGQARRVSGSGTVYLSFTSSTGVTTSSSTTTSSATLTPLQLVFVATAATSYITLSVNATGDIGGFDNISVKPAAEDRTWRNKPISVFGTITKAPVASGAQLVAYSGWSASNYLQETPSADLDFITNALTGSFWLNYTTAVASTIFERAFSSGAKISLSTGATGTLIATLFDGTTTRTVTSPAVYNNGSWLKVRMNYATSGTVSLLVNGVVVASTSGAPLLTMTNTSAVLTIGNSYALDAAFPGSITLVKFSAGNPSAEQSLWMYGQELPLFQPGAQSCLPDANAILDLAYDIGTDSWTLITGVNKSTFSGLVRTGTSAVPSGTFRWVAANSGVELTSRNTTTPGVDVTLPAYGLREELVRRNEAAAAAAKTLVPFDFDTVGFTATTTNASNQLTVVASVVGTPYEGMGITGAGIPANTTITRINGATYTMSANATATATLVAIGQSTFTLLAGWTASKVISGGTERQEGASKTWTRSFDGFRETIVFGTSPGSGVWVSVNAVRRDL